MIFRGSLAVGQNLPFDDNTFAGAISVAVLEHVDDPFACAKELIRVVRPGGKILCVIPFLQAEHGYPSHYFNATRFGVRKLFEGAKLERQWLEISNHPVFTLHQILGLYAAGLPEPQRQRFLDTPIRHFVETMPADLFFAEAPVCERVERKRSMGPRLGHDNSFHKELASWRLDLVVEAAQFRSR